MSVKVSCTEAERVDISLEEYNDLVRSSERIAAVERFVCRNTYASVEEILSVLGIEKKKPTEGEDNVDNG